MSTALETLMGSRTRARLLAWLARANEGDTVSALARLVGVTPPAARAEVQKLCALGLAHLEAVGSADVVKPNRRHPFFGPLRQLVDAAASDHEDSNASDIQLRNALAAYGAPFAGASPKASLPLEEALVRGLGLAHHDATVLRTLPVVFAKNEHQIDWPALRNLAYRHKRRPELGMVVEITAHLLGRDDLRHHIEGLNDARLKRKRYFFEPQSSFEKTAAAKNSPPAALRWGFYLNMGEEAFRATLEKHLA